MKVKLDYVNGSYILSVENRTAVIFDGRYAEALEFIKRLEYVCKAGKIAASFDICPKYTREIPPRYTKTNNY